jgi:hypothetical protein
MYICLYEHRWECRRIYLNVLKPEFEFGGQWVGSQKEIINTDFYILLYEPTCYNVHNCLCNWKRTLAKN